MRFTCQKHGEREPKFVHLTCPRHGDQGHFTGITIELSERDGEFPAALKPYLGVRHYCMACWIDNMDATMCQLVEVADEPEPTA